MRAMLVTAGIALATAGCVSNSSSRSSVDGSWASDDGVFVATFDNGSFTSRLTGTGETVVADGRYARVSGGVNLSWTSIAANEQRAASCSFASPTNLACTPSVGQPFTMTRVS